MIQKLWVINNDSSFSGWILHWVWLVLRTNLLWTTMVRKITKSYIRWQGRDAPKRWRYCFLGPSGMFLVDTFSVVWVILFISNFIVLSSFRKTNIRLHLPVNGVSKKTNKKCRNLHILIVVKENCKIFKIQSKRFWKKNRNFYSDKVPSISGMLDMANSILLFAILSMVKVLILPAQKIWLITLQVRIHINNYLPINFSRSASLRMKINPIS